MKLRLTPMILVAASMLTMATASAQEDGATEPEQPTAEERRANRDAMRERWQNMSDEERQAARDSRRERFENMSDEERQAMRDKRHKRDARNMTDEERQARRERWESMSDEERQAAREQRGKRQEGRGKHQGRGPGPEGGKPQEL